jgi:ABC-type Fe3+-siderophore transport system permease subunit
MKNNSQRHIAGWALVLAGVLLLLLSWLTGLANFNVVLWLGLILVFLGAIVYVWQQKRVGKY